MTSDNSWVRFKDDFDAMTDEQIKEIEEKEERENADGNGAHE